jgi:DNA-binding FadR family transcriptional regulator
MTLQPIDPRPSNVEVCAGSLRDAVMRGDFELGARLPPERELAETLGVNRVTVRGALAKLVTEGLLSVRQGSGYLVRDYLATGGPELISTLAAHADRKGVVELVRDLLEMRRGVAEVVLRRLATRRLKKTELAAIAQAIDAMEQAAGGSLRDVAEADFEVLGAVVAASGSAAFRLALNPLGRVLLTLPGLQAAMYRAPLENVAAWRILLGWLDAPTPDGVALIIATLAERDEATARSLSHSR